MRPFSLLLLLLAGPLAACAQPKTPADFGYRHLRLRYQRDTVDVLVLSKKGEELKRKPLLFLAQGSLPTPLLLYNERDAYPVFVFAKPGSQYLDNYHLAIASKPGVPVAADTKDLQPNFTYNDPRTGLPPAVYCQRNYLEYYAKRNATVLRYLARQPWVDARDISAIGHSEGSAIVARMARRPGPLRRVIYLSGSPLGRMLTMLSSYHQTDVDSTITANQVQYWQQLLAAPRAYDCTKPGDSNLTTASFSETQSPLQDFLHTKIPVFVGYGTRDDAVAANDYLRLETIRAGKPNFTFHAYPGLEHNFFGFTNNKIDYDKWNWDRVAHEFFTWMRVK